MKTILAATSFVSAVLAVDLPADPHTVVYKLPLDVTAGSGAGCTEASAKDFTDEVLANFATFVSGLSDYSMDPSPNMANRSFPSSGRRVHFLDTDDAAIKKGGYILRWRWDLDDAPDPYGENSDFTLKRRSEYAPTTESWTPMELASTVDQAQIKYKKQLTNTHVESPLYSLYRQFKTKGDPSKYNTTAQLKSQVGTDFSSVSVADWEKAFPGLSSYASVVASDVLTTHDLNIYQYEIRVGSGSDLRLTLNHHDTEVTHKIEASIILWCDEDAGSKAFTGELTWDLDYGEFDETLGKEFFAELVSDGLGGYVGGSTKTCAAYDKMGLIPCEDSLAPGEDSLASPSSRVEHMFLMLLSPWWVYCTLEIFF